MRKSVKNTGGVTYDQVFKSVGDPHRLQILALLREKELSAGEILQALDVVQSTLSHHMKSLVDAGVVHAVRHGKWTYYSLNTEVLSEASRFLEEYAEGTKKPAGYAEKEAGQIPAAAQKAAGSGSDAVQSANTAETKEDNFRPGFPEHENITAASSGEEGRSAQKTVKEKSETAAPAEEKEGKKKSKKGKKGKKGKK